MFVVSASAPNPRGLGHVFKLLVMHFIQEDPPKSPLKRGTLIQFSPLKKGGWGGQGVASENEIGIIPNP